MIKKPVSQAYLMRKLRLNPAAALLKAQEINAAEDQPKKTEQNDARNDQLYSDIIVGRFHK